MDEDRLTPSLGRLIDAAKRAAAEAAAEAVPDAAEGGRSEGWAVLGLDGKVFAGRRLAAAAEAARAAGTEPEAAAFAVVGETSETALPAGPWHDGAEGVDTELPVAVKYLGRWVLVTLGDLLEGRA